MVKTISTAYREKRTANPNFHASQLFSQTAFSATLIKLLLFAKKE
jgi:hypothetical protein